MKIFFHFSKQSSQSRSIFSSGSRVGKLASRAVKTLNFRLLFLYSPFLLGFPRQEVILKSPNYFLSVLAPCALAALFLLPPKSPRVPTPPGFPPFVVAASKYSCNDIDNRSLIFKTTYTREFGFIHLHFFDTFVSYVRCLPIDNRP